MCWQTENIVFSKHNSSTCGPKYKKVSKKNNLFKKSKGYEFIEDLFFSKK